MGLLQKQWNGEVNIHHEYVHIDVNFGGDDKDNDLCTCRSFQSGYTDTDIVIGDAWLVWMSGRIYNHNNNLSLIFIIIDVDHGNMSSLW